MTHLQGTPVVPGVAHAPALRVRGEVDPVAIERFGDGGFADADTALAAYDVAAETVANGFAQKAARANGAAAEVLTASAGLARDKGLRAAVKKSLSDVNKAHRNLQLKTKKHQAVVSAMFFI